MEIQESKLRRIRSEKEMLQKQLREQEVQLQAVSDKVQPKSVVAVAGRRAGSWEFRIFATVPSLVGRRGTCSCETEV